MGVSGTVRSRAIQGSGRGESAHGTDCGGEEDGKKGQRDLGDLREISLGVSRRKAHGVRCFAWRFGVFCAILL